MITDQMIDAVIAMQNGQWDDDQVADEISRLFPAVVKGMARAEIITRVTKRADLRVASPEAQRALLKFISEDHPEVLEFMKQNRDVTMGDALKRFGLLRESLKN